MRIFALVTVLVVAGSALQAQQNPPEGTPQPSKTNTNSPNRYQPAGEKMDKKAAESKDKQRIQKRDAKGAEVSGSVQEGVARGTIGSPSTTREGVGSPADAALEKQSGAGQIRGSSSLELEKGRVATNVSPEEEAMLAKVLNRYRGHGGKTDVFKNLRVTRAEDRIIINGAVRTATDKQIIERAVRDVEKNLPIENRLQVIPSGALDAPDGQDRPSQPPSQLDKAKSR